jgi:hypothetical protein
MPLAFMFLSLPLERQNSNGAFRVIARAASLERHHCVYTCGLIPLTWELASAELLASINEHNSRRSTMRNRHAPLPMTLTGSMGARSVKYLGIEAARPS